MRVRNAILLLFGASCLYGCGPGVADGAYRIEGGYVFYETGGNGKTIRFEERKDWYTGVIPERVDAYVLDGKRILVARRPAEITNFAGLTDWKLSPVCEYWTIDTETHSIEQITDAPNWNNVSCDMGKTYGAPEEGGN
jgi:hypothetical protein